MKYEYKGHKKFLILYPVNQLVENGTVIETTDKSFAQELIDMGFEKVKDKTKEGE